MSDQPADDLTEALADELATLPPADAARALRELRAWANLEANVHIAESVTEARIAPYHRRPLAERLDQEVRRREALGDITVVVWSAWAKRLR